MIKQTKEILTDIPLRDPFILLHNEKYYLYGTRVETCWGYADGFDVYVSDDLVSWSDAIEVFHNSGDFWADQNYWAPEVHYYRGAFYLFASFKKEGIARGTQILKAESPLGPFVPISDGPITPRHWECLDGTFYVDKHNQPYIVFCHEWKQIKNGTICAMAINEELTKAVSEPWVLFDAKSAGWPVDAEIKGSYITDGPFFWRMSDGSLILLWSSHGEDGYAQATARSSTDDIKGEWIHDKELLFAKDGGHGMVFRTIEGELMLTIHKPNNTPNERVAIFPLREVEGKYLETQNL